MPIISGGGSSSSGAGAVTLISKTVLGVDTASFSIPSISNAYSSLLLLYQLRTDLAGAQDNCIMRFNGLSTAIYDWFYVTGGSAAASSGGSGGDTRVLLPAAGASAPANSFSCGSFHMPQYAATSALKMMTGTMGLKTAAGTWVVWEQTAWFNSTAAIASLTLAPGTGTVFKAGSYLALYGYQ